MLCVLYIIHGRLCIRTVCVWRGGVEQLELEEDKEGLKGEGRLC